MHNIFELLVQGGINKMEQFYRFAPQIMGLIGITVGISGYVLKGLLNTYWNNLIWVIMSIIWTCLAAATGVLLKKTNLVANTDQLTGLKNRRYGHLKLTKELKNNNLILCIAMVDVDNFKEVNDVYGHEAGDDFLVELAGIIKKNIRKTDIAVRWGGDEFLVIFPHDSIDKATVISERLRKTVEKASYSQITLSIGVAAMEPTSDLQQVLRALDKRLYKAKLSRNTVVSLKMCEEN